MLNPGALIDRGTPNEGVGKPISANIVTKDFFNPKKVQKGPHMGENTILG